MLERSIALISSLYSRVFFWGGVTSIEVPRQLPSDLGRVPLSWLDSSGPLSPPQSPKQLRRVGPECAVSPKSKNLDRKSQPWPHHPWLLVPWLNGVLDHSGFWGGRIPSKRQSLPNQAGLQKTSQICRRVQAPRKKTERAFCFLSLEYQRQRQRENKKETAHAHTEKIQSWRWWGTHEKSKKHV